MATAPYQALSDTMKPYSLDLREKILQAYLQKEGSIRHLAKRCHVSARCVGELVVRFRRTGHYAPKPHGGGHPPCIVPAQHPIIRDLVKQFPDATLTELCHRFAEYCQTTPSKSSMQRVLALLQLTRKKRPSTRQRVTQRRYDSNGAAIKNR
jgi:transposase